MLQNTVCAAENLSLTYRFDFVLIAAKIDHIPRNGVGGCIDDNIFTSHKYIVIVCRLWTMKRCHVR